MEEKGESAEEAQRHGPLLAQSTICRTTEDTLLGDWLLSPLVLLTAGPYTENLGHPCLAQGLDSFLEPYSSR